MSDAQISYKHYRLYVTKNLGSSYTRIDQVMMFESRGVDAVNVVSAATATAISSGDYSADNNASGALQESGYWESNSSTTPTWLHIEFTEPKPIRAFYFKADYTGEMPSEFKFQASTDGVTWIDLFSNAVNEKREFRANLHIGVSGVSQLSTGIRSSRVLVSRWATGELIESIIPSADGAWVCFFQDTSDVLVTHIGPSGYEPKSDGPITPFTR